MSEALRKAKLKLKGSDAIKPEEKVVAKKRGRPSNRKHSAEYLKKAFETAKTCTSIIPEEEARVNKLVDELIANKAQDKYWEVRVNYHISNLETMKKTYPELEEEAHRREAMIAVINRKNLWADEKEKCRLDTMYWFDNYAWTADPRKSGIWALPFMLYDFQRDAINWLEDLIFLKKTSGLIEKSRDLGLSWLITSLFYKHWQHPRDGVFSALMGSITSDECDKVGDPSSMFEKLRIQARLQPMGLLPTGWDCTIPYMKAINPENGSTITGETSNADFGRSGRYKCLQGNTLIHTPDGLEKIKDFIDRRGSEIIAPDGSVKKVKGYLIRPPEQLYKVKLRGGITVEGTADHPLMKVRSNGELIETTIGELKKKDKLRLVPIQTKGIKTMSLEKARILGYLVSEGYVAKTDGTFQFTNADDEILKDYEDSWYSEYDHPLRFTNGTATSSITGKVSNWKVFTVSNQQIRKDLAQLGLGYDKSPTKEIPSSVLIGTPEIKKAFLQSLFEGDGGIYWDTSGNPRVSYTSQSEQLLIQLQQMLLQFGIVSTRNKSKTRKELKLNLISYNAYLFGKVIGFRGTRKNSLLPTEIQDNWKIKPLDVEILSIEQGNIEDSYDIECEDHLFISNGIISHNCILFDEFSAFEYDTAAMTASSQSSPCKIYNSTARGMGNEFYRLAHSGTVEKKTFHWKQHPYKDENWYEYQKLEMNPIQVAQELDINYDASQPNKVYYDYKEPIHIVTKSEIMRALPDFRDKFGRFRIPFGHKIVMGEDVGQTQEHAHVMLWAVVLKEGTKTVDGIDLSGHVIWYRELVQPPHSPPRIWANSIKEAEGMYEPKMIDVRYISHEADTEIQVYWDEYNLSFEKWHPDYVSGISRVREYLDVTREHEIHPFREHTRKMLYPNAKPFMGRPTMFFAVDDEQGELKYEPSTGRFYLTPATDNGGFQRTRFEFPAYHYPTSELGKEVKKMRPKKKDDDAMDVIRCIASEYFAPINPKTQEEKWEEYLPSTMKKDNINKTPVEELGMLFLQREQLRKEYENSLKNQGISYRDSLWNKASKY